jgi:hypothetical protein
LPLCGWRLHGLVLAVPDTRRERRALAPNQKADEDADMTQRFPYAIDRWYLPLILPFGLKPKTDGVLLTDDGGFVATFGFFTIATPLTNITGAHITRNYRWWTAFGVRGSMADDGLSFGTNHAGGVCIHFADKVPSRLRKSGHSALTVTVRDLDGLASALNAAPSGTTT